MDPLKAAAATLACLALFWLAFRLTRRLVDLAIAGGYAEERLRLAAEAAQDGAVPVPAAPGLRDVPPRAAASRDAPSAGAIGPRTPAAPPAGAVQGASVP